MEVARRLSLPHLKTSLFYLWILEQLPSTFGRESLKALDLGCGNFFYVSALCQFLSKRSSNFTLTGLEVDPGRLYIDFYRRRDYASYFIQSANQLYPRSHVSIEYKDWLKRKSERCDLITTFFPFLFEDLHDRFGLPQRSFHPEQFYRKIFLEAENAVFFHQGDEELKESLKLIEKVNLGGVVFVKTFSENPFAERKQSVAVIFWKQAAALHELRPIV